MNDLQSKSFLKRIGLYTYLISEMRGSYATGLILSDIT